MLDYTLILRGLLALYGLYVLLAEVAGGGRFVRHAVSRILFALLLLVWFGWLFVFIQVPYGWGYGSGIARLMAVEPAWLRSGVWAGWMFVTLLLVLVPHLLYRSRRAGDGLIALVLLLFLAWIISPLNNLANIL